MAEKSNEEFQKAILEILKQQGEKMEGFKKEIREKIEKPGIIQKDQTGKDSEYGYVTSIVVSVKVPLPPEETSKRLAEISAIMKPLMKKYQISKLECFVIRNYG